MKILVVGNGGREHAMAWKIAQSSYVKQVFVAPGNGGTAVEPKVSNVNIPPIALEQLVDFAQEKKIDCTIIGPEAPLVAGIVDKFRAKGLACFGPDKNAAKIEGSKIFAKSFLERHGIKTASGRAFSDLNAAKKFALRQAYPLVIKADGLAAGKGVVVVPTFSLAKRVLEDFMVQQTLGEAGRSVVIEEYLEGEEVSFIGVVDGEHILPLASARDHKKRDDGERGPNTGGMGAYSPVPGFSPALEQEVLEKVMTRAVQGMQEEGTPFRGFLYAGLMVDKHKVPKVLEFNCRLGDPETQPILMRLRSDWLAVILAALEGRLHKINIEWRKETALGVVVAASGYPESYPTGDVIEGLPERLSEKVKVFHAGTRYEGGQWFTTGGRVLCVTALGDSLGEAHNNAYQALEPIQWKHRYFRRDIGIRGKGEGISGKC
ncbi:MAG: phosphoribosylamine--glycine ligase [Gammaproteobacteria bacterium]|nr:phosphoribosylamine--glycine ligase [Gammaproteobacteria bacterium]